MAVFGQEGNFFRVLRNLEQLFGTTFCRGRLQLGGVLFLGDHEILGWELSQTIAVPWRCSFCKNNVPEMFSEISELTSMPGYTTLEEHCTLSLELVNAQRTESGTNARKRYIAARQVSRFYRNIFVRFLFTVTLSFHRYSIVSSHGIGIIWIWMCHSWRFVKMSIRSSLRIWFGNVYENIQVSQQEETTMIVRCYGRPQVLVQWSSKILYPPTFWCFLIVSRFWTGLSGTNSLWRPRSFIFMWSFFSRILLWVKFPTATAVRIARANFLLFTNHSTLTTFFITLLFFLNGRKENVFLPLHCRKRT